MGIFICGSPDAGAIRFFHCLKKHIDLTFVDDLKGDLHKQRGPFLHEQPSKPPTSLNKKVPLPTGPIPDMAWGMRPFPEK